MKANQLGWKRHVLREDSQSTKPNELQLEIRRRRGRTMNTFWMRMKGKDGEEIKVACWPDPNSYRLKYQNKKRNKRDKENKKIGRRWEKDSINRGQPGLIRGNEAILLAIHTYSKCWDWRPCAFHSFTHREMYIHTHQMVHSCSPLEGPQGLWDQRVKSPQAGDNG